MEFDGSSPDLTEMEQPGTESENPPHMASGAPVQAPAFPGELNSSTEPGIIPFLIDTAVGDTIWQTKYLAFSLSGDCESNCRHNTTKYVLFFFFNFIFSLSVQNLPWSSLLVSMVAKNGNRNASSLELSKMKQVEEVMKQQKKHS